MRAEDIRVEGLAPGCELIFGDVCRQVRQFLEGLRALHPDFGFWQTLPKSPNGFVAMADDWGDLDEHLQAMVQPDEAEGEDWSGLDENGVVTAGSCCVAGYDFHLFTSVESAPALTEDYARPDYIEVALRIGGRGSGSFAISLPAERSDLLDPHLLRAILLLAARRWHSVTAAVVAPAFSLRLRLGHDARVLTAEWLTYVQHPLVASSLPEQLPCSAELVDEEAVLFQLSAAIPDAADGELVARAQRLQKLFDLYHFEHDYLLFGWPDDPAERAYAAQIGGGPSGQAYVVGFTAFDGYDSERKVLLVARLFRHLTSDELGIGPWFANDPHQVTRLPIVALARQQLAALDYVGTATPIEWHIGIEQHADAVRHTLHRLAGIAEARLTVRFTPAASKAAV